MSITTIAILVIVVGTVLGTVGDAQVAIPKKREELSEKLHSESKTNAAERLADILIELGSN